MTWTIAFEGNAFEKFVRTLPPYEQAVLAAALEKVLQVHGIDICSGEWGKPLGGGLYEFRVQKSLQSILGKLHPPSDGRNVTVKPVQLRIFCTFTGNKVVLLYGGYNKGK